MKTQPYGKLTQHACLTTPLRNLTLFRFLLTPKFHMTRPLLSSSWEVSCGAQLFEGTSSLQVVLEKPPLHGSHRPGMGLCACFCVSAPAVATSVKDQEHSCSPYVPKVFPCMQVCITQMISSVKASHLGFNHLPSGWRHRVASQHVSTSHSTCIEADPI